MVNMYSVIWKLLFRIEEDPQLRAAFRHVADGIWANHVRDAQRLFTYIYFGLAPDAPEKEQALREALYSLQTFPSDTTQNAANEQPLPGSETTLPTYLARWDNEYIWKGNLLGADGWLSRLVIDVAVSPEDSQVIYAVGEEGEIYQSRDGAANWENWIPITRSFSLRSRMSTWEPNREFWRRPPVTVSISPPQPAVVWQRLPVPQDGGTPVSIAFDPNRCERALRHHDAGRVPQPGFRRGFPGRELGIADQWPAATRGTIHRGAGRAGTDLRTD